MEINLLPKIPNTKRYKFPISLIVAFFVFTPSVLVGWQAWENNNIINTQEEQLQAIENEHNYYEEQLLISKKESQLFKDYFTELNLLKNKNIDWVIVLDELASKLPSDAKITKLIYNGADSIMINSEFASIDIGAQYIQWLQTIDWIEEINSAQSQTQTDRYLLEIELKIRTQTLLEGGDLNE
ncbi:MAG: PilN domain-containing protein [Vulcanibacillus sp.]